MATKVHHRDELGGLLAWHPLRWLGWLSLGVTAVPAARLALDAGHFVPGGLAIETDGASGQIEGGRFRLALPMRVYNGTSRVITKVSLWVDAYACPAESAALTDCAKFTAFEQSVPMETGPKRSGWFAQDVGGGLPDQLPGSVLRIVRTVQSVEDAPVNGEPQTPGEIVPLPPDQSAGPA